MEKVMTRKQVVVGVVIVMLLTANQVQAEVCRLVNGSFEDDRWIADIAVKEPNGWDANVPAGKFGGYVGKDWVTDPNFNLTLFSQRWAIFDVNDMATVSQQVNLTGVGEVTFDLKLDTYPKIYPWGPDQCTAVLLIDGDVVWESNSVGPDVRGEYFGQSYAVEDKYKDGQPHLLSLGMRVNVAEKLSTSYITQWDSIKCTILCGGNPILTGDFNRDCFVDANDLKLIAELWLDTVKPNDKYNLFHGDDFAGSGTISFLDFAVFADRWDGNVFDLGVFADKWLQTVDANDPDNLFHLDDVAPNGVINFSDLAVFADKWLCSSYVEGP
jgi:hypothetical protein